MTDPKKAPSQEFLNRISDWTSDNIIIHHGPNHPSNKAPASSDEEPSAEFLDRISDWTSDNIIIHDGPSGQTPSPPDRTPGKITEPTQPRSNDYPHEPGTGHFTGPGAGAFNEVSPPSVVSVDDAPILRPHHEHMASGIPEHFNVGDVSYRPAGQQNVGRTVHEIGWKSSFNGVDISKEQVLTKYDDPDLVASRAKTRADGDSSKLHGRTDAQANAVNQAYGDGVSNWDGVEIQHNRVADIVIGGPGAGKSSAVAEPLARANGATLVDSDLVKKYLPGYDDGQGAGFVHNESSLLTYGPLAHRAIENGDNIVMPLVGGDQASLLRKVQMLKDAHYTVNLHYVDVDPEEQMRRVISRFKDPKQRRFVDPTIVLDADDRPRASFEAFKMSTVFAHTTWYDNNTRELAVHHVRAIYAVEIRSMKETHDSQTPPTNEEALIDHLKQIVPEQTKAPLPLRFVNDEDVFGAMMEWRKRQQGTW